MVGLFGLGAIAPPAGATLLIQSHTDPVEDPTPLSYRLERPAPLTAVDFQLRDGEERGFGPFEGTVVAQVIAPTGWDLVDIQCVGPRPNAFMFDVPNGRVMIDHRLRDENVCSFTARKASQPRSASTTSAPSVGFAPAPPRSALASIVLPRRAALTRIVTRRRAAVATIRLMRRSIVKSRLLWRGREVGGARLVRRAGTYEFTVRLRPEVARSLRRQGRTKVTLTLRIVVAATASRATQVFVHRVRIPV